MNGNGCPKCATIQKAKVRSFTTADFIKTSTTIHNNKYDYGKVKYKNSNTKVCVICPEHGEFWQGAFAHMNGAGCRACAAKDRGDRCRHTQEQFVSKSREVHGNKYDYSKVQYKNMLLPKFVSFALSMASFGKSPLSI